MSFILDALRKSERDRQIHQGPSVYHSVEAKPAATVPPWAWAIIALLLLLLIAVAASWLFNRDAGPVARPVARTVLAEPKPAATTQVRSLSQEARAVAPPPIAPPAAPADSVPRSEPESRPTASTAESFPATLRSTASSLPTLIEVEDRGLVLPDLNLDIHVYSNTPAERFVFLNGAKYREGEETRDGPRVVEIVAEGVVLDYQSTRFLLPWE